MPRAQLIGVVVADTEAHARAGARLVRVEYEDLPAILSTTQWVAAPEDERKCFEVVTGDSVVKWPCRHNLLSRI